MECPHKTWNMGLCDFILDEIRVKVMYKGLVKILYKTTTSLGWPSKNGDIHEKKR